MPLQTYIVSCAAPAEIETIKGVAQLIRDQGGLILMATRQGRLVIAFDDARIEAVRKLRGVDFVGGVTLDPRGAAARQLHAVFTSHLAVQVRDLV